MEITQKNENIRVDSINEKYYEIYNDLDNEEIQNLSWLKITKSFVDIGKFFRLMYILTIIAIVIYVSVGIIAIILLLIEL